MRKELSQLEKIYQDDLENNSSLSFDDIIDEYLQENQVDIAQLHSSDLPDLTQKIGHKISTKNVKIDLLNEKEMSKFVKENIDRY